ncbi:MAG TPA: class I SAM-dependent methyltransferase [Syntrophorhabdales bacterium]|nr:class I SAM-dependent methyltransferase [Syntrophorhabdales bacterium]
MGKTQTDQRQYDKVYGDTFAMYSTRDMLDFIEPFKMRFARNGLDPETTFKGKLCFDAGCGNGRGSLFMLMNGAAQVTAYDISQNNVVSTRHFAKEFGFTNIEVRQGSLEQIPFAAGSFDVIWCNGVIMHTERPNACLEELARVLKIPGRMWLYVYGAGGVYWRIISHIRSALRHISVDDCIAALKLFRYETRYIAEFIDDWYTTYLRAYTPGDMVKRLEELGFDKPELLRHGTDYDTSHRINSFRSIEEEALMGEGDLRYLLDRVTDRIERNYPLGEGEYGSHYQYDPLVTEAVDPRFREIADLTSGKDWMKVASAAYVQRELRILLSVNQPLTTLAIKELLDRVTNWVRSLRSL